MLSLHLPRALYGDVEFFCDFFESLVRDVEHVNFVRIVAFAPANTTTKFTDLCTLAGHLAHTSSRSIHTVLTFEQGKGEGKA